MNKWHRSNNKSENIVPICHESENRKLYGTLCACDDYDVVHILNLGLRNVTVVWWMHLDDTMISMNLRWLCAWVDRVSKWVHAMVFQQPCMLIVRLCVFCFVALLILYVHRHAKYWLSFWNGASTECMYIYMALYYGEALDATSSKYDGSNR